MSTLPSTWLFLVICAPLQNHITHHAPPQKEAMLNERRVVCHGHDPWYVVNDELKIHEQTQSVLNRHRGFASHLDTQHGSKCMNTHYSGVPENLQSTTSIPRFDNCRLDGM